MVGAILLIILLYVLQQPLVQYLVKRHRYISRKLINGVFFYHVFFWLVYYIFTRFNASDSVQYFKSTDAITDWLGTYQTGTKFIHFVAFPFVRYLGFNYEMMMALFAWFGFIGFLYFYIFFKESNRTPVKFLGFDLITVLLFLPNMHFWTASFGKGSIIFLGLGLFAYAIKKPQARLIALILGSVIIFNVRPHVFLFAGVGAVIGYLLSNEKISIYQKIFVYVAFAGAIAFFYSTILAVANISENDVSGSFQSFANHRAESLSESGSGVDINNYPLIAKLFTFWFRPLFIDAPGALGIFVSFENLIYLLLFFKIFDRRFIPFLLKSSTMVKMSGVMFILSSIALSFVMSNLGIASRQKSMVMYFLFFVILSFLSQNEQIRRTIIKRKKELRLKQLEHELK